MWPRRVNPVVLLALGVVGLTLGLSSSSSTVLAQVSKKEAGVEVQVRGGGVNECNPRVVKNDPKRIVCLCDTNFCGDLSFEWPTKSGQAYLVQSSEQGSRFEVAKLIDDAHHADADQLPSDSTDDDGQCTSSSGSCSVSSSAGIRVNLDEEYQAIIGWGGAFTDSAGINIASLPDKLADQLLRSYFGPTGLQYNAGRVPIGGADFSPRAYTYDDTTQIKPDYALTNWSLANEDLAYKIPIIQKASKLVGGGSGDADSGESLKLFASPWSPPAWMKTNHNLTRGFLIDQDAIYKSYAEYLMRFFDAYQSHGVKFWGATVQNEPLCSFSTSYFFNSLQMGPEQMIKFAGKYLGPALAARNMTRANGFKLMVGDDNVDQIANHLPKVLDDPDVQKYVAGLAFHWYSHKWANYDLLLKVHEQVKDKIEFMLMTEACSGFELYEKHVDLGNWTRGEDYASDIIEDLRRFSAGWIDWNLALDTEGGPNWASNFVDSPIIVDAHRQEFVKQPMYYALAHFSRFFRPGSIRIGSQVTKARASKGLKVVAVHNKQTGHVVVNILNQSNSKKRIRMKIGAGGAEQQHGRVKKFSIHARSISSLVVKL